MAGAGAEGGAAMGVLRDGAGAGGGEECLGAILWGGEAARPRLGILSLANYRSENKKCCFISRSNTNKWRCIKYLVSSFTCLDSLVFSLGSVHDSLVKSGVDNIQHQGSSIEVHSVL